MIHAIIKCTKYPYMMNIILIAEIKNNSIQLIGENPIQYGQKSTLLSSDFILISLLSDQIMFFFDFRGDR